MKIHANLNEAKLAIYEYTKLRDDLSERLGVYEECEDSCCGRSCGIYATAKYYGSDGKTVLTVS
jgi:hypothetical protein